MKETVLIINIATLMVTLFLVYVSYRHRRDKGGLPFLCTMVLLLSWVAGSTIELFAQSYEARVFWRNFIQIGMAFIPIANLWFVIEYTETKNKYLNDTVWLAAAISLIGIILTFTNPLHHLIRKTVEMVESNGHWSLYVEPAFWGNMFVLLRFALMLFSIIILILFQIRIFRSGQKQVLYILIGFILALTLLLIKNYLMVETAETFPMSVIFLIPNLFIAYSVYRHDFLKIAPLAKDWIINSLPDGIVVLSAAGEIVEVNPSAAAFFEQFTEPEAAQSNHFLSGTKLINRDFARYSAFLHGQSLWQEGLTQRKNGSVELELDTPDGARHYFEIDLHHFINDRHHYSGSVSVIRNVTSSRLERQTLKQQAEMDRHIQVLNKQAYIDYVNASVADPVSLLIIDIDKFKSVNDQYGHPIGDAVILKVVSAIKQCIHKDDLIGRIGGDEFSLTLLNCSNEQTRSIIRQIFKQVQKETADMLHEKVTVSIGVLTGQTLPDCPFETLYQKADEALYAAKKSGGNQVVFYQN
ncbi:diguanylate cyclase domain-containing protein [Acetobacterium wieringae]|uniref:histidine kinase N-terminal 7TM domain-containing diguanylate cyclase n=1 Tax=Acetobacterium wieringae TaxID=52694 RepID=UPI0026F26CEE|nr:diguanylate cyclase [Acetobacterium wieringae]